MASTLLPRGALRALTLGLVLPLGAAAQTSVRIPLDREQLRQFAAEPADDPCTTCGVVVSVRSEAVPASRGKTSLNLARNPTLTGGPGGQLATVPIGRTGAAPAPETVSFITVRYDDGSYGRVEERGEARVREGDRVRVIDGRAELRQR